MGISTSTGTLTAGQSRTFNLSPASAVTLTLLPNVRVTITESPAAVTATGLGGNATRVHEPRLPGTFTYGPYPMGGTVVVENESNSGSSVSWVRSDALIAESVDGTSSLVDGAGNTYPLPGVHPRYFTHLFAGNQLPDDPVVYDISGAQGHATPEADLSVSALWTTASGYASTLDPTSTAGQRLRKLRMPALNWDNAAGESLFIWWLGKATAEGSTTNLMGNCSGVAGENGFRIRVASSGALAATITEGTTLDSFSSSTLLPFDGNLHSIGFWINGQERKGYSYVDETVQVGGTDIDPLDTLPTASQVSAGADLLRLGGDTQTGGAATSGMATATRALVILKFAATDSLPTTAEIVAAMQALRAAPQFPIRRGAL